METAKRSGRTAFGQMIKFMQKNPSVSHILVEKTDRLYRNLKDRVLIDDLGCVVHFVKEGQIISRDSKSSEKFTHDTKLLVAKNYIDNLSEEVRKGQTEKAEQGIWPSCASIGYINVEIASGKRGIAPDQQRADLVRRAFELYATGNYSLKQLVSQARSAGLTFRKSGRPVNKATIHGMLRNLIYTGDFIWDGKEYKGIHEPIVSRELWDQVQAVLNKRYSNRYRPTKHELAFSGLIRCGHCGCAVVGEIKKNKYVYYHCTHQRGKCPEKYAREQLIDAQFCEAIGRITLPRPFVDWALEALRATDAEDAKLQQESIARLNIERARIEKRLDAMYSDKLEARITAQMFDRHAAEWRIELAELDRRISQHHASNIRNYIPDGAQLLELLDRFAQLFEQQPASEKRKLLKFVVSNSTWKEGTLTVQYRQPFDLFASWRETMANSPITEQR